MLRRHAIIAGAIVAAAIGTWAYGQQPAAPPACASQKTTAEMRECANYHLSVAEADLAKAVSVLTPLLNADQKTKLPDAQKAWVAYREAKCTFESLEYKGGTLAGPTYTGCLAAATATRAAELLKTYQRVKDM